MSYASKALSMPCFAFKGLPVDEWGEDVMDGFTCQECGWPYWSHSHRLNRSNRRDKNIIIPAREARSYYDCAVRISFEERRYPLRSFPYPGPDTRPRYDMMMDRTPGVCEFVAAVMVKERNRALKPGKVFRDHEGKPVGVVLPNRSFAQQGIVRIKP